MKISFKVSATSVRMVLIPTSDEDDVLDEVSVALLRLLDVAEDDICS